MEYLASDCPACTSATLIVEDGEIGCDTCELSWTWVEILEELAAAKLKNRLHVTSDRHRRRTELDHAITA